MGKPQVISEARSINSSLKRVKQSVKVGVLQAESASAVLEHDGALISDTLDEHKYGLRNALATTKGRLSKLKFAELREKYTIYISLGFFALVVSYIVLKRTRALWLLWMVVKPTLSTLLYSPLHSPQDEAFSEPLSSEL